MRTDLARLLRFLAVSVCFPGLTLIGQTLQLTSGAASPGGSVEIRVFLKSPRGRGPAAVQWEARIPSAQLSLRDVAIGAAAQQAGKSIRCAVKGKTVDTQTSVCILAGGVQQIQDGPIALLRLSVSPQSPLGPARIRVERAITVAKDLTEIPMKPVEAVVSVRQKATGH